MRPARKVSSHFERVENLRTSSAALMQFGNSPKRTLLHLQNQALFSEIGSVTK